MAETFETGRKGKKPVLTVTAALLAAALLLFVFAAGELRQYLWGIGQFRANHYEAAAQVFEQLSGYRDADAYLLKSRYAIALKAYRNEAYAEAAEVFQSLGDYKDSEEKAAKCHYNMGSAYMDAGEYEQAVRSFEQAGDVKNAAELKERCIYSRGHELFLQGEYGQAQQWFDRLGDRLSGYGSPHFADLEAAKPYLKERAECLDTQICVYIGQMPEDSGSKAGLLDELRDAVPCRTAKMGYDEEEKLLRITDPSYYPGWRIVSAWKRGDTQALTQEESAVMQAALELVEQAQAETDGDLALELWLHDWLCRNVSYDSPDMDVPTEEYLQLRQLTCVGAVLDGAANCQGYTDAFYLLGTLAGLEVGKLSGDADGPHTWNVICLDGIWYFVDVTFDDSDSIGSDAWSYTWFNCAYDPELYCIEGGECQTAELAVQTNVSVSYFGLNGGCCTDAYSAGDWLVRQYLENGGGWGHVMIEGAELDWDDLSDALEDSLVSYGVGYVSWTETYVCYGGNSYFSVYWD